MLFAEPITKRTGVGDADGVDELVEEGSTAAPPLEERDALGANPVGEQFDEVRCMTLSARGPRVIIDVGNVLYVSAL